MCIRDRLWWVQVWLTVLSMTRSGEFEYHWQCGQWPTLVSTSMIDSAVNDPLWWIQVWLTVLSMIHSGEYKYDWQCCQWPTLVSMSMIDSAVTYPLWWVQVWLTVLSMTHSSEYEYDWQCGQWPALVSEWRNLLIVILAECCNHMSAFQNVIGSSEIHPEWGRYIEAALSEVINWRIRHNNSETVRDRI